MQSYVKNVAVQRLFSVFSNNYFTGTGFRFGGMLSLRRSGTVSFSCFSGLLFLWNKLLKSCLNMMPTPWGVSALRM